VLRCMHAYICSATYAMLLGRPTLFSSHFSWEVTGKDLLSNPGIYSEVFRFLTICQQGSSLGVSFPSEGFHELCCIRPR
jgi:hypothetical protein